MSGILSYDDRPAALCDRLIYLMQGRCVFDGTPDELKVFFGVDSIEEVYGRQNERSVDEWQRRYQASGVRPNAAERPAIVRFPLKPTMEQPTLDTMAGQTRISTARYFRLQMADVKNLLLLFDHQPPTIALMIAITFGSIRASFAELHAADTKQVAFVLVLAVLWCFGTISVREIVKELPILRHELRFGVGLLPYMGSKVGHPYDRKRDTITGRGIN